MQNKTKILKSFITLLSRAKTVLTFLVYLTFFGKLCLCVYIYTYVYIHILNMQIIHPSD